MSLPHVMALVLVGVVAGAVALWWSLPSPQEQSASRALEQQRTSVPLAQRWQPTQLGVPRPHASQPRQYAAVATGCHYRTGG